MMCLSLMVCGNDLGGQREDQQLGPGSNKRQFSPQHKCRHCKYLRMDLPSFLGCKSDGEKGWEKLAGFCSCNLTRIHSSRCLPWTFTRLISMGQDSCTLPKRGRRSSWQFPRQPLFQLGCGSFLSPKVITTCYSIKSEPAGWIAGGLKFSLLEAL